MDQYSDRIEEVDGSDIPLKIDGLFHRSVELEEEEVQVWATWSMDALRIVHRVLVDNEVWHLDDEETKKLFNTNSKEVYYRFGNTVDLADYSLKVLYECLYALNASKAQSQNVKDFKVRLRDAIRYKSDKAKCFALEALPRMLKNFMRAHLVKNAEWARGWVYSLTKCGYVPVVITDVHYHEKASKDDTYYCTISYIYCDWDFYNKQARLSECRKSITVYSDSARGYTVQEILAGFDFILETPELNAKYDKQYAKWRDIFTNNRAAYLKSSGLLVLNGKTDEHLRLPTLLVVASKDFTDWNYKAERYSYVCKGHCTLPIFLDIPVYYMREHCLGLIFFMDMTPVVYNQESRKYVILPELHGDLVDAITESYRMRQLEEKAEIIRDEDGFAIERPEESNDIFKGKSGGFLILSIGAPGVGKTSVAESVANTLGRPLYRLPFGFLLGNDMAISTLEKNLKYCMDMADVLGLVPLLDEADVIVTRRNPINMKHYAIVAAALPILEYFTGLLFLTSNQEHLDDAVVSRMSAVIRYDMPNEKARVQMWKNQAKLQGVDLTAKEAEELGKKIVGPGRLITRLVHLVKRYAEAKKLKRAGVDLYKKLAVFQGAKAGD